MARANLLGIVNGRLLTVGVALVGDAAGNVGKEVGVAADAADVEQATACDLAAAGELLDAGLLIHSKILLATFVVFFLSSRCS